MTKQIKEEKGKSEKQHGVFRQTFSDIVLLYKHFVHWNISKTIFFLYGLLLGFICITFFALLYYVYVLIFSGDFKAYFDMLISQRFSGSPLLNLLYAFTYILSGFGFYFSYILLIKLNNSYLKGETRPFFKNEFLNYKLFWRYILLTLIIFLIFLIPILIYILTLFLVVGYYGGLEATIAVASLSPKNFFTIFSFVFLILLILLEFYLFYRFIFSYFVLVSDDETAEKGISVILKKSFKKTAGFKKFFDFMKIFFVVFLFLFVVVYSTDISISRTYNDLNSYAFYISLEDTAKDTAKSLNPYYYENLEVHYSSLTSEEVQNLQNKYYLTLNIFKVFSFLLFNGIFLMTLNSFYRRQMLLD